MPRIIVSILFFCLLSSLSARIDQDSLLAVSQTASLPDTTRLQALERLIELVESSDSALHLSQQQYELAKSSNKPKWMATALHNIGYEYKEREDFAQAIEFLEQSLSISEEIGNQVL